MASRADQQTDGSPAGLSARRFTIEQWRVPEPPGMLGIEICITDGAAWLAQDIVETVTQVATRFCESFGVVAPAVEVTVDASLPSQEYVVRIGGATRLAGTLATSRLQWWSQHPAAGPGGRTGSVAPSEDASAEWTPVIQIARAVEEILLDDPGLLFMTSDAVRSALSGTGYGYWSSGNLPALLRELAKVRIPLRDKAALGAALKETEQSDSNSGADSFVVRVERISSSLLPNTVRMRIGTGLAQLAELEGSFRTDVIPRLREALYYELGVAFPRVELPITPALPSNAYEIVIDEVPRAMGYLPAGAYVDEPAEGDVVRPWVNPATGHVGGWMTAPPAADPRSTTPLQFLSLHLAACLREAAPEFTDLAWTERVLENLDEDLPSLRKAVKSHHDELIATVLARLVAEGNSLRALPQIAARLLEFDMLPNSALVLDEPGHQCEADWLRDDAVSIAEYVRSGMKNEILLRHSGGTNVLRVLLLDTGELEKSLHRAVWATKGDESVYAFEHAADFLRRLRDAPELAGAHAILTDVLLRPYVRRLIAAQFPLLAVLSYQELPMSADIKVRGRISLT